MEPDILEDDGKEPMRISPWIIGIISLFIIAVLLFSYLPQAKPDPEPKNIPSLEDVSFDFNVPIYDHSAKSGLEVLLDFQDDAIKKVSDTIAYRSCPEYSRTCYAKAIFYFARDNFQYIDDPPDEYVKFPREMLRQPAGDCEDVSLLLANMLGSLGMPVKFVYSPGHVHVKVYIDEAKNIYKDEEGWIPLDATCRQCKFAQLPN